MTRKVGVIPFDVSGDKIAIMFVTSQKRGRWILPKGNLHNKESHKQGCKREAIEEAGIKGKLFEDFPMTHSISKSKKDGIENVAVTYYPFLVAEQFDNWPEKNKRERHWSLLDDALRVTDQVDFHNVINNFAALKFSILDIAKQKKEKQREKQRLAL